jgi:hypothetical protein
MNRRVFISVLLVVTSVLAVSGFVMAVVVNQATTSNLNVMSYSAGGEGSTTVPWLMKNRDNWQGRNDWYGGLVVQNPGSSPATVNVSYYNTAMS